MICACSQHKVQVGMYIQGTFKPFWASAQSDLSLSFWP